MAFTARRIAPSARLADGRFGIVCQRTQHAGPREALPTSTKGCECDGEFAASAEQCVPRPGTA